VIVVGSNDLQSLYVANNVCSAVEYFRKLGGNVGVAGMVINKDDGTGEAQAFAEAVGIPVLASIPPMTTCARNRQLPDRRQPRGQWGALFAELARTSPRPRRCIPDPLTRTSCWAVRRQGDRRGFVLEPATDADMRGKDAKPKSRPSK
jgi:chlorophyllide a reductase subunit X